LLNEHERELFRQQAGADGLSLNGWLKQAGHQRLSAAQAGWEFKSADDLQAVFARCDQREEGREPDWEQHLEVITCSKDSVLSDT